MKTNDVYTKPRLCDCKGDIAKSWYVYFYYNDYTSGKKSQFRYKLGINRYKTKTERKIEAAGIIEALKIKLESGWNPVTGRIENNDDSDLTVSEALDKILEIKKSFITKRSYKTYYDQLNLFKKWLEKKRYNHLFVYNITNEHLRQYFDYLLKDKQYCGKTHNSHLTCLRTFFNALEERNIIKSNPAKGIKMVRQETGKNTTYSMKEENTFNEYACLNDKNFFYATRFVRYCFLRRSELSNLKIKHINWENKTIIIPSEIAKSRNQDSVTIPKSLEDYILEMGILDLNPEFYIFSKNFVPGAQKLKRVDDFSDRQRKYNKKLNIKSECSFYSWKHTGVVELYNRTKDPYIVMRQCRHSDIKMTMIYLRSLGCGVNEEVRKW